MKPLKVTTASNIHALVIDNHALVSAGLKALIQKIDPQAEVAQAADAQTALHSIQAENAYDLICLDVDMPDMSGMELLQKICAAAEQAAIVVISSVNDPEMIQYAASLGVKCFLPKDTSSTSIIQNIKSVLNRDDAPQAYGDNVAEIASRKKKLNKRQLQILQYLSQGMSNREISQTIFLSEGTIKNHFTQIFNFLGVSNRTQAIIEAEKRNLIKS